MDLNLPDEKDRATVKRPADPAEWHKKLIEASERIRNKTPVDDVGLTDAELKQRMERGFTLEMPVFKIQQ